jgi:sirohydrochlorin ferrochelatase
MIVPACLIVHEIERLRSDASVLAKWGAGDELRMAQSQISALESVLEAGRQSADDELTADQASEWSGLRADTLRRKYREAEIRPGFFRRGALPIRAPFLTVKQQESVPRTRRTAAEPVEETTDESGDAPVRGNPVADTLKLLHSRPRAHAA